jgi:CBS domain-containing protein
VEVSELMRTPVVTTTGHTTLCAAAARMRDHGIGALAVVDDDGALAGIITERDLVRAVADGRTPRVTPVEWYASPLPATIGPDADCSAAARIMVRHQVRHLPVTRAGRPVGMLAARDLLLVEAWSREVAAAP